MKRLMVRLDPQDESCYNMTGTEGDAGYLDIPTFLRRQADLGCRGFLISHLFVTIRALVWPTCKFGRKND